MTSGERTYHFQTVPNCSVCGSPSSANPVVGKRLSGPQGFNPKGKPGICVSIRRCSKCELVYPDPLPVPESLEMHYGVPPDSYWKPEYFTVRPELLKTTLDVYHALRPHQPGRTALDIGAGIGKHLVVLQQAGFDAWGIEPSKPFHFHGLDKLNLPPDRMLNLTVEEAEFAEGQFDFILMGAVFEHLYQPAQVLRRVLPWLKPGGLIYIEVPSANWLMNKLVDFSYRVRGLDYTMHLSPMHSPFHIYEFTPLTFQHMGQHMGFRIEHHQFFQGPTYVPGPLRWMSGLLSRYMRATQTGMQLAVWITR